MVNQPIIFLPVHYIIVASFFFFWQSIVVCDRRYDRTPVDEAVSKGDLSLIECITRATPIPEEPANGDAGHGVNMEDA